MPRITRDEETRDAESLDETWTPSSSLPDPQPEEGFGFRWIRKSIHGDTDGTNLARARRDGWLPVSATEQPVLAQISDSSDFIEVGGLLLCKMPSGKLKAMRKYFEARAREQQDGVARSFKHDAQPDPRMPLIEERSTKTSRNPLG